MTETGPILVTGATGAQGGAVVDTLLEQGVSVRALVRDPQSVKSKALAGRGVDLVKGDFYDEGSLAVAATGVTGVFSVQTPPAPDDLEREIRAGRKLIEAAKAAGVNVFVHTSVARAGEQETFVGWEEGRWWPDYWNSKAAVNDAIKEAGFAHWVILKPAYMMDNFIPPKAVWMYPSLATKGAIETSLNADTRLDMIAAADVGRFAAAAFANPESFDGQEIDLAAECLTMDDVANILSNVSGATVLARSFSPKEARAAGIHAGLVQNQQWVNVEGYKVDLGRARSFGIPLSTFSEWAEKHSADFAIGHA